MSETRLSPDQKGHASLDFAQVIVDTQHLHPDKRFHGKLIKDMGIYKIGALKSPYPIWVTADGIGTKPELAERLAAETSNPKFYESLAFDTFAMIDGDVARFGYVLIGIAHVLDYNTANSDTVSALAKGTKKACIEGRFPLLNGETAELGYRTSGYGENRLNWNAFGVYAMNKRKLLIGKKLEANQPIIAIREKGIRSNGLTRARGILETGHLLSKGYARKEDYVADQLVGMFGSSAKKALGYDTGMTYASLDQLMGHPFLEQVQIPWHQTYPELTEQLLTPSILYGRLMYEAQGGIDKTRQVDITAAAHITGGGIPEKMRRILQPNNLGAEIEAVFPEPQGIQMLLDLAGNLPYQIGQQLIDDRRACEQWNRGIGFAIITKNPTEARKLIRIAEEQGYEAAIAGKTTDKPVINFRGHQWTYNQAA